MRVITVNLNGIRSAASKGFFDWMRRQEADVVCLQEVRAQEADCTKQMLGPKNYYGYFHCAEKKGYAGVAIYTKKQPDNVKLGIGVPDFDVEGRYLQVDFGKLSVISLYLPSGSSGPARQAMKFHFMDEFYPFMKKLAGSGREYIICGDWNIAHKEIDLKNWRSNQKNSGFLPEERAWLTKVFDELSYVDVFRRLNDKPEQYTWWSNRGQAWAKNVGWRIDYQIATPGIAAKATDESIYKRRRFSDHAPLIVDYDYEV
ncbi:MAG: exodeoxyribonuclease III [Gammaproteobacteria bacterium]|nr:exodeoxyribonuclease III [Gammaproteobacteria bacterium]